MTNEQELSQEQQDAILAQRALEELENEGGMTEPDQEPEPTDPATPEASEPPVQAEAQEPATPATPQRDLEAEIKALEAKLAELQNNQPALTPEQAALAALYPAGQEPATPAIGRNKVAAKPKAIKYVLLKESLPSWGRVPQQQADIADIITRAYTVNEPFTETELFTTLQKLKDQYPSLRNSVQDVTYLFRYYRGLSSKDGKHGGFVARGFLREA